MSELEATEVQLERLRDGFGLLTRAVEQHFVGHRAAVEELLYALLAGGHVLLEGVPGLGKTLWCGRSPTRCTPASADSVHARPDAGRHRRHERDARGR
jgi:hypothetical protein